MSYNIGSDHPLCGTWVAGHPEDTSDYKRAEYQISIANGQFQVSAIDRSDDENFVIYDVSYDGECLSFVSLMPSTGRTGRNRMRIVDKDKIEFVYTFTDREIWRKKPPELKIVK